LYVRTFPAVSGYVLRRVADKLSALVVVAAVFTVAGERRAEDPPAPEDRLWLFGVARRKVLEHHRAATVQTWVAPDGSGRRVTTVDPTPAFFTSADRAAWVAAGEPPVPHSPLTTVSTFGSGTAAEAHSPVPLYDVRALPTAPSALRKVLSAARLPVALAALGDGSCSGCCRLFVRVVAALQGPDRCGSPALRAALFRVLASVPDIDLLGATSIHGSPQGTGFRLAVTTPAATWEKYCLNAAGESVVKRTDRPNGRAGRSGGSKIRPFMNTASNTAVQWGGARSCSCHHGDERSRPAAPISVSPRATPVVASMGDRLQASAPGGWCRPSGSGWGNEPGGPCCSTSQT
jgi:hypothetical protein